MKEGHKLVFIGGLHRSGTSLLVDMLKQHPAVSSFENTGFPEDEGQFLQSVYPIAKVYGGPGKFAFSREMHLTEDSELFTEENRGRLYSEWSKYWEMDKRVLLEKSPPNLIKMRFLQAVFPKAFFIILIRDPVAVSMATEKWTDVSISRLIKHWIAAHEIYNRDKLLINKLFQLSYEDLTENPEIQLKKIMDFIGVEQVETEVEVRKEINREYRDLFRERIRKMRGFEKISFALNKHRFESEVRKMGYSLKK